MNSMRSVRASRIRLFAILTFGFCLLGATQGFSKEGTGNRRQVVKVQLGEGIELIDEEASKLTIRWIQIKGPKVKVANPTKLHTYFIPTAPGKYVFELQVTDPEGAMAKEQFEFVVAPPRKRPVAIAGPQKRVQLGEMVTLEAIAEDAKRNEYVKWTWMWNQISGPDVNLAKDELRRRQIQFKPKEKGTYVWEVRCHDQHLWSKPSRVSVVVFRPNKIPGIRVKKKGTKRIELPPDTPIENVEKPVDPIVVVPEDQVLKLGEKIILDGTKSSDPKGREMKFFWEQINNGAPDLSPLNADKSSARGKRTDWMACPRWWAAPKKEGRYVFVLRVTVGSGEEERSVTSRPVAFEVVRPNNPPNAVVTKPQDFYRLGDLIKLDGSNSSDPDKDKLNYQWVWTKKPRTYFPNNVEGDGLKKDKFEFRANKVGVCSVQLIVTDEKGAKGTAEIDIVVKPANNPPEFLSDTPKEKKGNVGIVVTAKVLAKDKEKDTIRYQWKQVSGPAHKFKREKRNVPDLKNPGKTKEVVIDDPLKQDVLAFTPQKEGRYVFEVVALDNFGSSKPHRITFQIKPRINQVPYAQLKGPRAVVAGKAVEIRGDNSKDPEGKNLTYLWSATAGPKIPGNPPGPKDKKWKFKPVEEGTYEITLQVSDGEKLSDPVVFAVRVDPKNNAPKAVIRPPSRQKYYVGESILFDGSPSFDPDRKDKGKITFSWKIEDRSPKCKYSGENSSQFKISPLDSGRLTVQLIVRDKELESKPALITVVVKQPNKNPVAKISGPTEWEVDKKVQLSGRESFDPDGDKKRDLEWRWLIWKKVDNDKLRKIVLEERDLRKEEVAFKPDGVGVFVIHLYVIDGNGAKSPTARHELKVSSVNKPPIAVALLLNHEAGKPYETGETVRLTGRNSRDPEGSPLTYLWKPATRKSDQLVWENPEDVLIANKTAETIALKPNKPGLYAFELTVSDGRLTSVTPGRVEFRVKGANTKPTALIADIKDGWPGEVVTLDGSNSFDNEKDKLEYSWRLISKPKSSKTQLRAQHINSKKFSISMTTHGNYVFELRVFDGRDWSAPDRKTLVIKQKNQPPEAILESDQYVVEVGDRLKINAEHSNDPDKGPMPLKFLWRVEQGKRPRDWTPSGNSVSFVPDQKGEIIVRLVVEDGLDESKPVDALVRVLAKGTLPVAVVNQMEHKVPVADRTKQGRYAWEDDEVVKLDASKSRPKGKLKFSWKQIQGEKLLQSGQLGQEKLGFVVFTPSEKDEPYEFQLRVKDTETGYWSRPVTVRVIVYDPRFTPPSVRAGMGDSKKEKTDWMNPKTEDNIEVFFQKLGSTKNEEVMEGRLALKEIGIRTVPGLIILLENGKNNAQTEAHELLKHFAKGKDLGKKPGPWREWWRKNQAPTIKKK